MGTHRDLDVFKKSYELAIVIHYFSLTLPQYLQYDLGDQIRRASRSIPSNIAEGYARNQSSKDLIVFLKRALGSDEEMLFNLGFLYDTKLITEEKFSSLTSDYSILGKQLINLIRSINKETS